MAGVAPHVEAVQWLRYFAKQAESRKDRIVEPIRKYSNLGLSLAAYAAGVAVLLMVAATLSFGVHRSSQMVHTILKNRSNLSHGPQLKSGTINLLQRNLPRTASFPHHRGKQPIKPRHQLPTAIVRLGARSSRQQTALGLVGFVGICQ